MSGTTQKVPHRTLITLCVMTGNLMQSLDASIATDLGNLTNTGSALATTIDGFTATLQTELDSAATGLAAATGGRKTVANPEVARTIPAARPIAMSAAAP